jgi:hypothetical protein
MRTTSSQILSYTAKSGRPTSAALPFSIRPAHEVLGWTELQKADWALARDRIALAAAEANYSAACKELGLSNKMRNKTLRRINVAAAFRMINRARADIRRARAAIAASEAALAALSPAAGAAPLRAAA